MALRRDGHLAGPAASPVSNAWRSQISARQPLLYAALAYGAGLWAGKHIWRPPTWWVLAEAIFLCCAIYLFRRRTLAASALALSGVFATGALTIQVQGPHRPTAVRFGNEQLVITAHVIAEGEVLREGPNSWHQRIDIETERIESESQHFESHVGVRLNVYSQEKSGAPSMPLLRCGQRIRFPATLVPPRNFRNPGAFDYAGYLRDKGISATASTKFSNLEMIPGF